MSSIIINISDMAVSKGTDVLVTYALGSCVGICLYDAKSHVGGLSHILLPQNREKNGGSVMKYADTAIPELIRKLGMAGANTKMLTAKIAGGAQMFKTTQTNTTVGQIGKNNVIAVKAALAKAGIRIIAEDTGLDYGRSVFFDLSTGEVKIKSAFGQIKML